MPTRHTRRARLHCVAGFGLIAGAALLTLAACAYRAPGFTAAALIGAATVTILAGLAAFGLSLRLRGAQHIETVSGDIPQL